MFAVIGRERYLGAGTIGFVLLVAGSIAPGIPGPPGTVRAESTVSCDTHAGTPSASAPLASYAPLEPVRLTDTRDGTGGVAEPLTGGCTLEIDLSDAPFPTQAEAVSLSVTAIAERRGFLSVFACEDGQPSTSNVNTRPGVPTPNMVIARVAASRRVCVFANVDTDVIVDLTGWFGPGPDRFASIDPVRAYDTRELPGRARLPAGEIRPIAIGGASAPAGATSAIVNLTVADAAGDGFLVAYACDRDTPLASNLNFRAGEARSVAAVVGLAADGTLCVMSNVDAHVIVDVAGWYAPAPQFGPSAELRPIGGLRVVDTRDPATPWATPFADGEQRRLDPLAGTAYAGLASAVVLNVVATEAARPGFVTIFPCTPSTRPDGRPLVSSLNYAPGGETTNLVTVDLSASGEICVYASQSTHVVIDLFGVEAPPGGSLAERMSVRGRAMFPQFTPDGTDYAVACDAATTSLTLDVDTLPGVAVRVNGLAASPGALDLVVPPDGLITVELRRGGVTRSYFLRCVPPDFPQLQVTASGDAAPGWYLTTFGMGTSSSGAFVAITDERGAPVWFKRSDRVLIDAKRLGDGRLAATPLLGRTFGIDPTRGYREFSLAGTLVAERFTDDPVNYPVDHHDLVELPGGGRTLLSYPLVRDQDLSVLGAGYATGETVVDGSIRELDAGGNAVWTWSTLDHFGYGEVTYPQRFGLYPSEPHGGEVDVFHLNSLRRVDDGTGDYVVSARHLDAVFRIERASASGEVAWILGGDDSIARPERLTIVGDPYGGPRRMHDARLNGDVLTMFDNRTGRSGEAARAVAYRIDTVAMTATMLWEIRDPAGRQSGGLGSVQVAPDGSVLVGWGGMQPMFVEYNAAHQPILSIAHEPTHLSYRVVKYPAATVSPAQLRAAAGGRLESP